MTDLARIKVLLDQRSDADYDSLRHIDRELGQMVPGLLAEVARLEGVLDRALGEVEAIHERRMEAEEKVKRLEIESRQRAKERNDADDAYHDMKQQRDRAMAALRSWLADINADADDKLLANDPNSLGPLWTAAMLQCRKEIRERLQRAIREAEAAPGVVDG